MESKITWDFMEQRDLEGDMFASYKYKHQYMMT